MSQNEFSRLHRTIQFSISCCFFLQRLIIYHSLFRLSSEFLKYFWDFLISVSFISSGPCGPQRCETLLNISSIFVLSNYFLKIFDFFIQPFRAAFRQLRCKTSLNISSNFVLSNAFLKIFWFFINLPCTVSIFSSQSAKRHLIYPRSVFCQAQYEFFLIFFCGKKRLPNFSLAKFLHRNVPVD